MPTRRFARNELHIADWCGDPATRLGVAASVLFLVGGLNIVIGLLGEIAHVHVLTNVGAGLFNALFGCVHVGLGLIVRSRSRATMPALVLAVVLLSIDTLTMIAAVAGTPTNPPLGAIVARVLLISLVLPAFSAARHATPSPQREAQSH